MKDPYSSVENMLQWQIDAAKKRIKDTREALSKCGELYPLPKPTDGLPDNWAFGKLTNQQVTLAHAMDRLKWASHEIEKAESALSGGDLPVVIHWIIQVNNSIGSVSSQWVVGASIRIYRYIGKYRQSKSSIAQHVRKSKPSKCELIIDREAYFAEKVTYQGWLKHAQNKYGLTAKTINLILK